MQVVAIHEIRHGGTVTEGTDAKGKPTKIREPDIAPPGKLFDLDLPKAEIKALVEAGAVREPTEAELAMAELVASKKGPGKKKADAGGADSNSGGAGADTQTGGAGNDLI